MEASARQPGHPWRQSGVIYQVYPRSFQDSNGYGAGDLPRSVHSLNRRLLALRRAEPALSVGDYGRVWAEGDVLTSYERIDPATGRTFLIALNLAATVARIMVDACDGSEAVICTNSQRENGKASACPVSSPSPPTKAPPFT